MTRRWVIATCAALCVVAFVVPVVGAMWYSWRLAVGWEQEALTVDAEQGLARAEASFDEVTRVLTDLDSTPIDREACSPEHIESMRLVAFEVRPVAEIGFFENGRLKCTSWGIPDLTIPELDDADFATFDGVLVTIRMQPLVTGGKQMMALQRGAYNALVDPARLVDLAVAEGVSLAIVNQAGTLLSATGDAPTNLEAELAAGDGVSGDAVFVTARGTDMVAVASTNRDRLNDKLADQRKILLPFAVTIGGVVSALIVWASRRRLSMLGELALAVKRREFVVQYQPILELATGRCVGAEALVRWHRPDGTRVRPDLFIPLAEDSGLIEPITDQVIDAVGSDLGELLANDPDLHIAVNLCASDVKTGRALTVVRAMLERHKITAAQLWLEATETGFVDIDAAIPHLEQARTCGHRIAIDDFGTGYSTLSHLQRLPVDVLKIDKSFVDTIGTNSATSSVTGYIIDMARTLGLEIVAEGVETIDQADYLRSRGVHYAQGWLYSPAIDPQPFADYYHAHRVASTTSGLVINTAPDQA
jgi:sensor c-di-GMP phosphodiesterase-like protein